MEADVKWLLGTTYSKQVIDDKTTISYPDVAYNNVLINMDSIGVAEVVRMFLKHNGFVIKKTLEKISLEVIAVEHRV